MSPFRYLPQIDPASLNVGDLLEIQHDLYEHWAVYIGNNEVVHLTGINDGERENQGKRITISGTKYNKAAVIRESISNAVGGARVRVNNSRDDNISHLERDEIRQIALSYVNQPNMPYHLLWNNCEHFANFCRYGAAYSQQSEDAVTAFVVTPIFATLAAIAAGALFYLFGIRKN